MTGEPGGRELLVYYALIACYFFSFGLQAVLYPALAAFALDGQGADVGLAQAALSGPMFALLLVGGATAERAQAGPTLAGLHLALAAIALGLGLAALAGWLSLPLLLSYGVAVGALAAFMLPLRDAALNGVVDRAIAGGRRVTLAQAVTTVTAVQLGAQILGILAARLADQVGAGPLLAAQAGMLAVGAWLSLRLRAPKPAPRPERSLRGAVGEIRDGLRYALAHPVLGPMIGAAGYVGVFIVGSFQVLFPLIVRDAYGGGAAELGLLFAAFWAASFVSAVALGRLPPVRRPGRMLILCQFFGALCLALFAVDKPWAVFVALAGVWGLSAGVSMAVSRTITQSTADPAFLARVLAVYSMGFMGGAPIGSALVGVTADHLGPRLAALAPAVGLALGAAALARFSPLWRLERR